MVLGVVLTAFKAAFIAPLLKKSGMYPADTTSYQPISNLSVLSKLLERLVAQQLISYLMAHDLLPDLQSAYRVHHSTSGRWGRHRTVDTLRPVCGLRHCQPTLLQRLAVI